VDVRGAQEEVDEEGPGEEVVIRLAAVNGDLSHMRNEKKSTSRGRKVT
jgi:hypothetical protein